MDLFDILACPNCKVAVTRDGDQLTCASCTQSYPIIDGVPVMFPDGSVPDIQHEAELHTRDSYDPWVHRTILQSMTDDQVVLEIGSGNMTLDDPSIIRLDVTLTPFVDIVADAHALPFLPGTFDYIFSLAVFEHLRDPFEASQSIFETLKDGGYIYHECNFVFSYHGYPHHYFNASLQGLEQVFAQYEPLRKGVAPYQMPSFALNMILNSYMAHGRLDEFEHGRELKASIRRLLDSDLVNYDIYFNEEAALNVAAGTYFSGYKREAEDSSLVPAAVRDHVGNSPELAARFGDLNDLTATDNAMLWAIREGKKSAPELAKYFESVVPFNKSGDTARLDRSHIHSLPIVDTQFGAIGFDRTAPLGAQVQSATEKASPSNLKTVAKEKGRRAAAKQALRWVESKI